MRHRLIYTVFLFAWSAARSLASETVQPVRFNRDIRPILAENCFHCHGPDPSSRKAKLRFDREEGLLAERDGGVVVVRGQPDNSLMFQRITATDEDDVMPPPSEHKKLKAEEIGAIKRWIEQGAPWEPHWSLIKPEKSALPSVRDSAWARNEIDAYVLARLEQANLKPAPEADRPTLARRLALDLTGLPPEPALVDAFVADSSKDAYERLVDRFLAMPQYGEHRAHYWLDAARYADTHGQHFDNYREIWPYRDWVIAAFNRDLPFDQFTVEQIAGDLLPDATTDQLIASGFHRCNPTTNEGGTIEAEALANYARDRVETTSWVWLGLTANCAVCHDHKFDPIPTRDFYAMSAFFRNTTQGALDGNVADTAPALSVPRQQDLIRWIALPDEIANAKKSLAELQEKVRAASSAKLASLTADDWNAALVAIGEPALNLPLSGDLSGKGAGQTVNATAAAAIEWQNAELGSAAHITDQSALTIAGTIGDFERDQPYTLSCWVKLAKDFTGSAALMARMDDGGGYRGWDVFVQGDEFATHLIHHWSDDALKVHTATHAVKLDTWQHVSVTYDGSSSVRGLHIYIDGADQQTGVEADSLKNSTRTSAPFTVGRRKLLQIVKSALMRDVRLYARALGNDEIKRLSSTPRALAILAKPVAERSAAENDVLLGAVSLDDPVVKTAATKLSALEAELQEIRQRGGKTLVQQEKSGATPSAQILKRGQYDQPGDTVEAGVFTALQPLPKDAPKNRLGLARWLVSADNPLTARVTVNRLWQEIFGTGLVKSVEDFGIMGDAPSHPELLDHLAVEFRNGWDVKKLLRTIVTSSTYRQAAITTPEKLEKDPANRLLSRGPRFRMHAEMVRDYALAAAGILSPKMGGPGVKPYQPDHIWDVVGLPEGNTRVYQQDHGEELHRRSIYTFWKRQAPLPSLEIFNAPNRETACLRRERTNTPLQALVTLNDPQFVEAARMLAQHAFAAGDDAKRLDFIARRVLARSFADRELAIVTRNLAELREQYRADPKAASTLVQVGEMPADAKIDPIELAAMTVLCSEILNLDEALNQ